MNDSIDEQTDLLSEFDDMQRTLRKTVGRSLITWTIRTTIGIFLFGCLALTYEWGKWILLLWIPFAVASLLMIVIGGMALSRDVKSLEGRLTAWDSD